MRLLSYAEIVEREAPIPQTGTIECTEPVAVHIVQHGNTPELDYNLLFTMSEAKRLESIGEIVRYYN